MASVFLSPSLQEFNPYTGGGNEEEYMNRVADAMEPYLLASGIEFGRNDPGQTLSQAIAQSNAGGYDLHLAIHSNAAGPALAGQMRGADVYYRLGEEDSLRAAEQIAADYRDVYPDPNAVQILPGPFLAELEGTRAPAVLIETAYHDNPEDAQWIRDHVEEIARSLSRSVAVYLGVPFIEPGREEPLVDILPVSGAARAQDGGAAMTYFERERPYKVRSGRGAVYVRQRPEAGAPSLGLALSGETVQVKGHGLGWAFVRYGQKEGYMDARKLYKE